MEWKLFIKTTSSLTQADLRQYSNLLPLSCLSRRTDGISGVTHLFSSPASGFCRNFKHTLSALLRHNSCALLRHTLALYCDILWRFFATNSRFFASKLLRFFCDKTWNYLNKFFLLENWNLLFQSVSEEIWNTKKLEVKETKAKSDEIVFIPFQEKIKVTSYVSRS